MTAHTPQSEQFMSLPDGYDEYVKKARKFDRDRRVIAARKQYKDDVKMHVTEGDAWAKANAVYDTVRKELGL
jgi:hypothetical protein